MFVAGALVLLEFAVLSFVYYYAYSYKITAPPASSVNHQSAQGSNYGGEKMSFCSFVCAILSFGDVFGLLTYKEDSLSEPLTVNKL